MLKRYLGLIAIFAAATANAATGPELAAAARSQVGVTLYYDPAYRQLSYPGGDIPIERGVCSDVVIRAYRKHGIDLQELVHRDMRAAFSQYPRKWGLKGVDRNIDHRRVLNLATYFERHGQSFKVNRAPSAYAAGDIVTWMLPGALPHIGIVSSQLGANGIPLVIHNIGAGTQIEDRLFAYEITGHYRFTGADLDKPGLARSAQ